MTSVRGRAFPIGHLQSASGNQLDIMYMLIMHIRVNTLVILRNVLL